MQRILVGVMFSVAQMLTAAAVMADPCAGTQTAAMSSIPEMNGERGGHLAQHVLGKVPPQGYSQAGKTLFASNDDWLMVWNTLFLQENALECPHGAAEGKEAARDVNINLTAKQCTGAGVDGACTASHNVATSKARVVFRVVNGQWIVFTAYPSN